MLKLKSLDVAYGSLPALKGVSLDIAEGGFVAIVGPNGAGKSTLFKAISGTKEPSEGTIFFEGYDLRKIPASQRVHLGIAHVPEGRRVFKSMSVLENLEMGSYQVQNHAQKLRAIDLVLTLFPRLKERLSQLAGTLSGGEQQMLAIGRGLACSPRLLMLDEPSMGLAPTLVDSIFDSIRRIHKEGKITVLLVEQRAVEALELCTYGHVLEAGEFVMQGTPDVLLADDEMKRAYLGM